MPFRFILILFLPFVLLSASCIDKSKTVLKKGLLYRLDDKSVYSGCVVGYYDDGKKEYEIDYADGRMVARKLYNRLGDIYSFERYRDGKPVLPIEMTYQKAKETCQKASFRGYHDWRLPSVKQLNALAFSELTRDVSYIASDAPRIKGNSAEVSYVHFGATPSSPKWHNDDLDIGVAMNVICVRKKNPSVFHLVSGIDGTVDLADSSKIGYPAEKKHIDKKTSVAKKKTHSVVQKSKEQQKVLRALSQERKSVKKTAVLRPGYYICIYTYSKYPPSKEKLDNIMLSGYRYKFSDLNVKGKELTSVLVGPFPNMQKAKKELKRVHRLIEADAYILDRHRP
jgi:hypothetical protein